MNAISHWLEKRRRRWTTTFGAVLHGLPSPAEPTCCLYCDFEGYFGGAVAAAHADVGTDRLLSLLDRRRMRITFNVVAELCRSHPQRVRRIRDTGHEIACHGYRHERPRDLTSQEIDAVLHEAGECFAELGIRPRGFRAPESAWTVHLLPALLRHGYHWNAERDPSQRAYRIHRELVRVPVRTDDWDLAGPEGDPGKLLSKWTEHAIEAAPTSRLLLVGVHEWILGLHEAFADELDPWMKRCEQDGWRFRTIRDALSDDRMVV